eukprot:UN07012
MAISNCTSPTISPTTNPTFYPTANPTVYPTTTQPTAYPTAYPTVYPTVYPTANPTVYPTYYPSTFSSSAAEITVGLTDDSESILSDNVIIYIGGAIVFIVLLIGLILISWCICCRNKQVEGKEKKTTRNVEMMNKAGMKIIIQMKDVKALAARSAVVPDDTPNSITEEFEGVEETAHI